MNAQTACGAYNATAPLLVLELSLACVEPAVAVPINKKIKLNTLYNQMATEVQKKYRPSGGGLVLLSFVSM